eukprot:GHVU01157330.1.p1 GENE.GHVU01157330.1~~GHVU01157330.1.p1  ORF type:complete len:158 (-),score=12.66 GHVU01157330.1:687-1160(-)
METEFQELHYTFEVLTVQGSAGGDRDAKPQYEAQGPATAPVTDLEVPRKIKSGHTLVRRKRLERKPTKGQYKIRRSSSRPSNAISDSSESVASSSRHHHDRHGLCDRHDSRRQRCLGNPSLSDHTAQDGGTIGSEESMLTLRTTAQSSDMYTIALER